jgi:hypothetical protein
LIVSFPIPAPQFSLFTKEATDDLVGQTFKAKIMGKEIGIGKVLDAEVSDNSLFIYITAEWPDDPISKKILDASFPDWTIGKRK